MNKKLLIMKKLCKFIDCFLIFILLLPFCSCSKQKETNNIFSQAENIVEQQPGSVSYYYSLISTDIILFLALLAAGITAIVYYRKSAQNKKLLLETEQKVTELQKIAGKLSEEEKSLRTILFQQFNIMKKTILMESEISDEEQKNGQKLLKKFNKIIYGHDTLEWAQLYAIINNLQNGLYDKIKEKYPQWSEIEFRIFCLSYESQFNDTEIAIILNQTIPMIRKIRTKIRKDLGIPKYSHDYFAFS